MTLQNKLAFPSSFFLPPSVLRLPSFRVFPLIQRFGGIRAESGERRRNWKSENQRKESFALERLANCFSPLLFFFLSSALRPLFSALQSVSISSTFWRNECGRRRAEEKFSGRKWGIGKLKRNDSPKQISFSLFFLSSALRTPPSVLQSVSINSTVWRDKGGERRAEEELEK